MFYKRRNNIRTSIIYNMAVKTCGISIIRSILICVYLTIKIRNKPQLIIKNNR